MITPEDISVARELLVEDVYHASTIFSPGDRWLDVGCHAGYFSLLALMHGASVVGGVDADINRANDYDDLYSRGFWSAIEDRATLARFVSETGANAIKLDIQGAESFLLDNGSLDVNKIVVEWHYDDILDLLKNLDRLGFDFIYCDSATDILTKQDTYIVYAERIQP